MKFIADLHIHSHFSIATSKQLCPEYLDHWGRVKGIRVIGAGDFTHPGWLDELREKLEPAEPGLFRLKSSHKLKTGWTIPETSTNAVRFLLTAEISNIYKKADRVRKVHNVLLAPDFEVVEKIQHKLSTLNFNITSDGRPILGLDSRDLFELALDVSPDIFLIPAHIWTPWFSALGAKSGFDSIEDCYGDLSGHISAVETGLSSDPPMNWRVSSLDRYTLLSNSDAHSPDKLGREANLFDTEMSYPAIIDAIKSGDPNRFLGTVEFFPQEGKYHHDGHRKCGISWTPDETVRHDEICPVCGKPVIVGVLNRVMQLADRNDLNQRVNRHPFYSTIPLAEMLSEIHGVGPKSKQIVHEYSTLLNKLGAELDILLHVPFDEIRRAGGELFAEAVRRMREGQVHISAGFDGEYGVIRAFAPGEISRLKQVSLFQEIPNPKFQKGKQKQDAPPAEKRKPSDNIVRTSHQPNPSKSLQNVLDGMNPEQRRAATHFTGPAMILAGPGTGKTRVLTSRIAWLIRQGVKPENILAVTFTNKAAREMQQRVGRLLPNPETSQRPLILTFHAFGYQILKEQAHIMGRAERFALVDEADRRSILSELGCPKNESKAVSSRIAETRQLLRDTADLEDQAFAALYEKYEGLLYTHNLYDLDDLISKPVLLFNMHPDVLTAYRTRFQWILVDEYQDVNFAQYQLIQLLMPGAGSSLFAIGDPDQAIYGFRGADVYYIRQFQNDYPDAKVYALTQSYRCTGTILAASGRVLGTGSLKTETLKGLEQGLKIQIAAQKTDKSEAEFIARQIEDKMGGLRFFSMDSAVTTGHEPGEASLSDFAVLCRTSRQMEAIEKAFHDHSIPCQTAGDVPFFQQEPVRSVVAAFRALCHPENGLFAKRVMEALKIPKPEWELRQSRIGSQSIRALLQDIIESGRLSIAPEHGAALRRMLDLAEEFGTNTDSFLQFASLGTGQDTLRPRIEAVSLLTLHAAKGLEFDCVFIAGCEEGLIPYQLFERETDTDEERRLLYVGMTRAKSELILTHAEKRFLRGREFHLPRSSFLDGIEEALIEHEAMRKIPSRKQKDKQLGLF